MTQEKQQIVMLDEQWKKKIKNLETKLKRKEMKKLGFV